MSNPLTKIKTQTTTQSTSHSILYSWPKNHTSQQNTNQKLPTQFPKTLIKFQEATNLESQLPITPLHNPSMTFGHEHSRVHNSLTYHSKLYPTFVFCEGKNHRHVKNILIYIAKQFELTFFFQEKSTCLRRQCK
jgi:hypothetical protein